MLADHWLGLEVDNMSLAENHPGVLEQLYILSTNGKNVWIKGMFLSHTDEGLPAKLVQSFAHRIEKKVDTQRRHLVRLIQNDGKDNKATILLDWFDATLPAWLEAKVGRRD
jgi:hypothetical protein